MVVSIKTFQEFQGMAHANGGSFDEEVFCVACKQSAATYDFGTGDY
jgi:hypothetical protein